MQDAGGAIRIAPSVLDAIVRRTALAQPGVIALDASAGHAVPRRPGGKGYRVEVRDDAVYVELFVVAATGINLLELGRSLQAEVTKEIENIVELPVHRVDVYVQDVG